MSREDIQDIGQDIKDTVDKHTLAALERAVGLALLAGGIGIALLVACVLVVVVAH